MSKEIGMHYFCPERILGFIIIYAIIPFFFSTFTSFKRAIPHIHAFSWDETFMQWDFVLHLGHHPWTLLHPLLSNSIITWAIDRFYTIWFMLLFLFPLWMAWITQRRLRLQFFISFMLIWILLGTILAILFSSAGPCYYAKVTGKADPFAPLLAYLNSVDDETNGLWAVIKQNDLWLNYIQGTHLPARGISAMPSMHVSVVVLFALAGWQVNRLVGLVLIGYALIIQIGSVHLGWHYAIDGYLSTVLTYIIWKATDRGLTMFGWEQAENKGTPRRPLWNLQERLFTSASNG